MQNSTERIYQLKNYIADHVNPFNHSLHIWYVLASALIVAFIFLVLYKKKSPVPKGKLTHFLEAFVLFIRNEISIENLGEKDGKKWAGFFCTLFFFILTMNLLGIIPAGSSATGNLMVTTALAIITFSIMTLVTISKNGLKSWFSAFIPSGVPLPILLFLVPIELLGVFTKSFALLIRLCANMFAGHIVLFSILGLAYAFGYWGVLPGFLMGVGMYALEVFVALLQAYIFTFLSAMFIGQMFHPEH